MRRVARCVYVTDMTTTDLHNTLAQYRFTFTSEGELQSGIATALQAESITFNREHQLADGRIDFLVGSIGIEVKVDGSDMSVARQLLRYAKCPEVSGLLLITTRRRHLSLPKTLGGVQIDVLLIEQGL